MLNNFKLNIPNKLEKEIQA